MSSSHPNRNGDNEQPGAESSPGDPMDDPGELGGDGVTGGAEQAREGSRVSFPTVRLNRPTGQPETGGRTDEAAPPRSQAYRGPIASAPEPPADTKNRGLDDLDEDDIDQFVDDAFFAIEEDIRQADERETPQQVAKVMQKVTPAPAARPPSPPKPAAPPSFVDQPTSPPQRAPRLTPTVAPQAKEPPAPRPPISEPSTQIPTVQVRVRPAPTEAAETIPVVSPIAAAPIPVVEPRVQLPRAAEPPVVARPLEQKETPPAPAPAPPRPAPAEPPAGLQIPVEAAAVEFIEEVEARPKGRPFGKYLLLEKIAVGGMAEVFKAKQLGLEGFEKLVAIKRILPHLSDNNDFVTMFIDEAKVAAQLTHQNICQIYDLGEQDGAYFLAMEYISGQDLKAVIERGKDKEAPLTPQHAALITSKLAAGLDYAHRQKDLEGRDLNIVHRDISPQNILISYEGEVKLIDFGIAKAASKVSITRTGALKGKILYMSPEQAQGLPIDKRSDIFSLGTLLFEMLTSRRLFMAKTEHAILEKVRDAKVLPPSSFNKIVPRELDRIILKALQKNTAERYQSAAEMQRDLDLFLLQSTNRSPAAFDLSTYMHQLFREEIERERVLGIVGEPVGPRDEQPQTPPPPVRPRVAVKPAPQEPEEAPKVVQAVKPEPPEEIITASGVKTDPDIQKPPRRGLAKSILSPFGIAAILFLIIAITLIAIGGIGSRRDAPPVQDEQPTAASSQSSADEAPPQP
ncbi:MAG: protein kinase [Candidatus Schekmanbacteria bacterium]|nr:protein kinase [Candidatus Schekmanbacteria bacterium]